MTTDSKGLADLIKDVDFTVLFSDVKACVPYILPAILGFVGLRKALSFIQGAIAGA